MDLGALIGKALLMRTLVKVSRWPASVLIALSTVITVGCGAKTGLLIPDASVDAEVEADVDVEPDVDVCLPEAVEIDRRRAEVLFVIDRSSSMLWALEGSAPLPGEPNRWEILRNALDDVLGDTEHLLEYGAKFFPLEVRPGEPVDPELACTIDPGIDLRPAPDNLAPLLRFFDRTTPVGGTPTAPALMAAMDYLESNPHEGVAQFVVLATDGGPNCNPEAQVEGCICTGPPEYCLETTGGFFNCLDDERTLSVINAIFARLDVPIFVIGIDDPQRPDLADFIDLMAIAGGRPRADTEARRFYSIRREGDLNDALDTITGSIARCLFTISPAVADDPRLVILLDGEALPRDTEQVDGWDWTSRERGELTIFGEACNRASLSSAEVTAELTCLDEE
jgi:predicted small lipoprotein YifL